MELNDVSFGEGAPIDGYGPGFFRIGGVVYEGAVLVAPGGIVPWAGIDDLGGLRSLVGAVDVLLIGLGAEIALLPPALRAELEAAGLGVDGMATPSACRTYNVLLAEGRRVAAALLPVA